MRPEKTGADQDRRDTRFKPGQSGNPSGRPKGSRHRVTLLAEQMVDGAAWPAAGFVDTENRCFMKPEVCDAEA